MTSDSEEVRHEEPSKRRGAHHGLDPDRRLQSAGGDIHAGQSHAGDDDLESE